MIVMRVPSMGPGEWDYWSWRLRAACNDVDSARFFTPTVSGPPTGRPRGVSQGHLCVSGSWDGRT